MKALSLFTGIGGFDLGFSRSNIETIAMCDSDKIANGVLSYHYPDIKIFQDVKDIDGKEYKSIDIIHGGFPCQDISIAGNREGLAGERSGLWWEFFRVISEAMPRWVVIENVTGLLSSGKRRDLGAIIGSLEQLGYMGGYRVLDARYFGVAQRRRRMFIVASLGNDGGQKVLFNPESLPRDIEKSKQKRKKVAGTLRAGTKRSGSRTDELDGHGSHVLIDKENGIQIPVPIGSEPDIKVDSVAFAENQRSEVIFRDLPTVNTRGGKPGQGYPAILTYGIPEQTGTLSTHFNAKNYSNLQEVLAGSVLPVDYDGKLLVRRLTPLECERLMGFPDNWTEISASGKTVSDTARYRLCGNAVVPQVAQFIGDNIQRVEKNDI